LKNCFICLLLYRSPKGDSVGLKADPNAEVWTTWFCLFKKNDFLVFQLIVFLSFYSRGFQQHLSSCLQSLVYFYWNFYASFWCTAELSGVNFINILRAAFTCADPKSIKWYRQLDWVLMLSGSAHVKAAHKTMMKSTPG